MLYDTARALGVVDMTVPATVASCAMWGVTGKGYRPTEMQRLNVHDEGHTTGRQEGCGCWVTGDDPIQVG